MSYESELSRKDFEPNVVIYMLGKYFCIRTPDSGLVPDADYIGTVGDVRVNPTSIDLKRGNTSIAQYSFRLSEEAGEITALIKERADLFFNQEVDIYIGRCGVSMPFSDYYQLPRTRVKSVDFDGRSTYTFSTSEETDQMNQPFFDISGKLSVTISAATTTLSMETAIDTFPASGMLKIDNEFISYAAKDNGLKQFTGCIRAEKGSTAVEHKAGAGVYNVIDISGNPLDLLLQLLISNGGGGAYDVLDDGLGIDPAKLDVTGIEDIRDSIFASETFAFSMYNVTNALKFLEDQILLACNLRFCTSEDSKLSVALLDQSVFGAADEELDENTMVGDPRWKVAENQIINQIVIDWDWDEGTAQYKKRTTYTDATSITNFGARPEYALKFKGIIDSLDGQDIVDDRAARLLARFATPAPEIQIKTMIDKHLLNVGDKVLVTCSRLPSAAGTKDFSTELEVLSRSINFLTGDVTFKLAFTSYSGIRKCYIAPSDLIASAASQSVFDVASGRGALYRAGYVMRLWNEATVSYEADAPNEIDSVSGDTITMATPWATTLIPGTHRMRFADYNDTITRQKRYGFFSDNGLDFVDGSSTYRIIL